MAKGIAQRKVGGWGGMGQGWEVTERGKDAGGQMREMLQVADKAAQEERKKTEGEVGPQSVPATCLLDGGWMGKLGRLGS